MIGYTAGVFDMFHIGHLKHLQFAKSQCDWLVVGITTDELCSSVKGKTPIIPYTERAEIISSLVYVDEVVPQTSYDRVATWERIKFDRTFVGDDWRGSDRWRNWEFQFAETGVEVVYFPYTAHVSSSLLREVLNNLHGVS